MKIKSIKIFLFIAVNWLQFNIFTVANAQVCVPGSAACAGIPNPLGDTNTLAKFIGLLLDTIFPIAAMVSVFFIIYSGFLMVTAGANEEKLSKARMAFLWTVIGVGILLGAKMMSAVICGTVNQLSTSKLTC